MKLGILGGGAWGTALAQVASAGGEALLWALENEVIGTINRLHQNPIYLPGVELDPAIRATGNFSELSGCDAWLVVTPAQHMRAILERMPCPEMPLVLCAKGIEESSGKLLHEVAKEVCPSSPVAVLSGPTFADEVAKGLPTAVTLAAEKLDLAEGLRARIARPEFRIYVSDDVTGAEIGGAVKNVLAIACGAQRETLAGLSGLGDLVLTCSSKSSRNYSLGIGIGEGCSAAELLADRRTVAEGAFTAPVLARVSREKGIDMPIVNAVDALVAGRANVDQVLDELLSRPPRAEGA